MKPAWLAEPTLLIPTLLTGALLVTPLYILLIARILSFADVLPVKAFMSLLYISDSQTTGRDLLVGRGRNFSGLPKSLKIKLLYALSKMI